MNCYNYDTSTKCVAQNDVWLTHNEARVARNDVMKYGVMKADGPNDTTHYTANCLSQRDQRVPAWVGFVIAGPRIRRNAGVIYCLTVCLWSFEPHAWWPRCDSMASVWVQVSGFRVSGFRVRVQRTLYPCFEPGDEESGHW